MVGINQRFGQNYQMQTKKVAAQEDGNNKQQTQQAETQAVKQPTVPTLQQPTVKIPLETLQANVGIKPAQPQKPKQPEAKPLRHLGTMPDDETIQKQWLLANKARPGDTVKLGGDVFIISEVRIGKNGMYDFVLERLND